MAAKKKSTSKPKFGSAAWFAKYPKAKKIASKTKSKKKR
jgi:hypothetical protein